MAIRKTVLICVYKLGGVVHEVETSQITITNENSSDFDRVVFHRYPIFGKVNMDFLHGRFCVVANMLIVSQSLPRC